jgi:hypothetical protein
LEKEVVAQRLGKGAGVGQVQTLCILNFRKRAGLRTLDLCFSRVEIQEELAKI